jgi:hypothetical protein
MDWPNLKSQFESLITQSECKNTIQGKTLGSWAKVFIPTSKDAPNPNCSSFLISFKLGILPKAE